MEYWHNGFPFWWKGTQTQEGNMEFWRFGQPGSPGLRTVLAQIPLPAIRKVDKVLQSDSLAFDKVLKEDVKAVMKVSNV